MGKIADNQYFNLEFDLGNIQAVILFSDGIIDQKGGLLNKKLYTSGLKNWAQSTIKQVNFEDFYSEFKQNQNARDDATLIYITVM